MNVYIALDGYTLPSGFIVKEICIMFPNGEYNHFLLKAPKNQYLTDVDKRTIRYTTAHLNNLSYDDGDFPYENIDDIFAKFSEYRIYTYSETSLKFLQNSLQTSVIINIQNQGFQMPTVLPDPICCRVHNNRYCAKAKAIAVKSFIESWLYIEYVICRFGVYYY